MNRGRGGGYRGPERRKEWTETNIGDEFAAVDKRIDTLRDDMAALKDTVEVNTATTRENTAVTRETAEIMSGFLQLLKGIRVMAKIGGFLAPVVGGLLWVWSLIKGMVK